MPGETSYLSLESQSSSEPANRESEDLAQVGFAGEHQKRPALLYAIYAIRACITTIVQMRRNFHGFGIGSFLVIQEIMKGALSAGTREWFPKRLSWKGSALFSSIAF